MTSPVPRLTQPPITGGRRPSGAGRHGGRRRLAVLPAVAGVGYLAMWIIGLLAWPSNLALDATNAQVATAYRVHSAQAATQIVLVEGLAGLLLGVVLWRLLTSASGTRSRAAVAATAIAVLLSVAQSVLGLVLIAAASHLDIARSGVLFDVFNRMDGVKMLTLAGVAAYAATSHRGGLPVLPRWLRTVAGLTAVALVLSGGTYLLLAGPAAWTVYLSGPLLLLWITATGVWLRSSGAERSPVNPSAQQLRSPRS
jgi:hypothetical protein